MRDITQELKKTILPMSETLFTDIASAKNLVDNGQEVKASRRLQGALTRSQILVNAVRELFYEPVADENSTEAVEDPEPSING